MDLTQDSWARAMRAKLFLPSGVSLMSELRRSDSTLVRTTRPSFSSWSVMPVILPLVTIM